MTRSSDNPAAAAQRRVRVIFLASSMQIGGQEQYIAQQIKNMNREKFDVTLFCLKDPGPMADVVVAAGIPVTAGFQRFKFDFFSLFRLTRAFRSRRPDILYVFDFRNVLFIGRLAARLAGVKVVVIASHKMNHNNSGRSFKWLDLQLMPLSHHVIAAAHMHRDSLIANDKLPGERITAIHNGIQLSRLAEDLQHPVSRSDLGVPDDSFVIGTVARLSPEKAQLVLLAVAKVVIGAVPHAHLVFVGDGPERQTLEAEVRRLGIERHVHFLGFRKRVAPIVRNFNVFALSSTSTELFSAATLEAMALGIPVVVTNVGGMSEMVVPSVTGYLVPPNDVASMATHIIELASNADAARALGAAGRERVSSLFTAEREAQRIEELFAGLLEARA